MPAAMTVVKVGGSLFDLPDLARRLTDWLQSAGVSNVLLVPGGGVTAHAIRRLDASQQLGDNKAHWLALRSLSVNAQFLADLLPKAMVVGSVGEAEWALRRGLLPILDAYRFAQLDEGQPGCLPHCWEVTSDSIAARVAIIARAHRLVLLKSATLPAGIDWAEAGRQGFADRYFATVVPQSEVEIAVVNLREWPP